MFVLHTVSMNDSAKIASAFRRYARYLNEKRDQIPQAAYEFASATWHYDPDDHRCLHDSWVEQLSVKELSAGERSEVRRVEISVRLLGAYQDGWINLVYADVKHYSLRLTHEGSLPDIGHGDWLIDELRLSECGLVVHEVVFSTGTRWFIECGDIRYSWIARQGKRGRSP